MILHYEFIDANGLGYKERRLTYSTELFNKISAQEVNNLKDKVNEVVDSVNAIVSADILSTAASFKFIQKGFGNIDLINVEIGDIFCGWKNDGTERWIEAKYEGGLLTNSDNFTPLLKVKI